MRKAGKHPFKGKCVALRSPDGKQTHHLELPKGHKTLDRKARAKLGDYKGWRLVKTAASPPADQPTPEQLEDAKWNVMTRPEIARYFQAQVDALEARIAALEGK